jgi:hypothetical protein
MSRDEKGNFQKIGEGLGGLAGQAADQAASLFGSVLGSMTSMADSWWGGESASRAARSFDEEEDRACREHHGSRSEPATEGSSRKYEARRPLYQFGHVASRNPRYRGRRFEEVENDLQKEWGREQSDIHGDWPEVRGFVGFGYERGTRRSGGSADAQGEIHIRPAGEGEHETS